MTPTIYEVETIGTGKLSIMAMPASHEEFSGLRQLGIDHVVSLLEVNEQFDVGLWEEETLCAENGMRYTSFPITDRDVPQKSGTLTLAATLYSDIYDGEHVVIHCRAGIGRTGIIASAVLIQSGYSPSEAMHMVSWARGVLIPDTKEQNSWINSIERLNESTFHTIRKEAFLKRMEEKDMCFPADWAGFEQFIKSTAESKCRGNLTKRVPPCLILSAYYESSLAEKHYRFSEQLDWAYEHYCFDEAIEFLISLPDDAWKMRPLADWNRSID